MADDYQPGVCPPQWCWGRLNEIMNLGDFYNANDWAIDGSFISAFVSYIWQHEEPPVDPALAAMREAIAVYEGVDFDDDGIGAAVASLRKSGVLK